jgi:hypothetical protein
MTSRTVDPAGSTLKIRTESVLVSDTPWTCGNGFKLDLCGFGKLKQQLRSVMANWNRVSASTGDVSP